MLLRQVRNPSTSSARGSKSRTHPQHPSTGVSSRLHRRISNPLLAFYRVVISFEASQVCSCRACKFRGSVEPIRRQEGVSRILKIPHKRRH
jgi:hypothetical protein